MKIQTYTYPKSSFLSLEKDLEIITSTIMKNERLKKLLYYNTKDCMDKPNLSEEENIKLFGNNIKLVPRLYIDNNADNYIVISFDNFVTNQTNPEFRDNIIEFDIVCHYDQWHLKDFQLRPFRIAAEIDSTFDKKHLTGIGQLEFVGANIIPLNDEYGGISLLYAAIHGEEDKKNMPNPADEMSFRESYNQMFNA